jgi:hypothetical protein
MLTLARDQALVAGCDGPSAPRTQRLEGVGRRRYRPQPKLPVSSKGGCDVVDGNSSRDDESANPDDNFQDEWDQAKTQ